MTKFLLIFGIFVLTGLVFADESKCYENFKIYKLECDVKDFLLLSEQFKHLTEYIIFDAGLNAVVVSPDHLNLFEEALVKLGINWTVTVEDVSELISHERSARATDEEYGWKSYYDLPDVHKFLRTIAEKYPDITELVVTGHSYEGREILGLIINTDFKAQKPQAYVEGTAHAREWTSTTSVTYLINRLLTGKEKEILTLKEYFEWHIFPVFNPDGYTFTREVDRFWRKNRSPQGPCYGVDLNRNWNHGWGPEITEVEEGSSDPCTYQIYNGPNAFSELETIAQSNYILTLKNLDLYFAVHAAGGYLLIPWADRAAHIANYDDEVQICKTAFTYARKVAGGEFDDEKCGTAYDVLSFSKGNGIDWVRDATNVSVIFNFEQRESPTGTFFWPATTLSVVGEELVQVIIGTFAGSRKLGYFKE